MGQFSRNGSVGPSVSCRQGPVLAPLSDADALRFTRLRDLLGATDGNLGAQMRKLEEAGYVSADKEFVNRKPVTWYALTEHGRRVLKSHIGALEGLINAANLAGSQRSPEKG